MPTYEYECSSCGHKWDLFQSIKARPIRKCPECGRQTAKRLIGTGGGVIFKGSGFYQTDYRSESYKKAAKADADASSSSNKSKDASAKKDTAAKDNAVKSTSKSSAGSSDK